MIGQRLGEGRIIDDCYVPVRRNAGMEGNQKVSIRRYVLNRLVQIANLIYFHLLPPFVLY